MERRKLLYAALAAGVGAMTRPYLDWFAGSVNGKHVRIGLTEVAELRRQRAALRALDARRGGLVALRKAKASMVWADSLLDGNVPDRLRPELHHAAAWLAEEAGFVAFDAGENEPARQCWRYGLAALGDVAETSDTRSLEARIHASLAREASWNGNHGDALSSANHALRAAKGGSPTTQAMAWATWARVHAGIHDDEEHMFQAREGVNKADDAFRPSDGGETWVAWSSDATHLADTGHTLCDLVGAGHRELHDEAVARMVLASAAFADTHARTRALSRVTEAVAMFAGFPDEGVVVGHQALDACDGVRSARLRASLSRLREACGRASVDGAPELEERIVGVLAA